MIDIKTVTVIGVTGTMGANVAGIFASFGNAKVYCVGRDIERVKKTLPRIVKTVKADAIIKNLIPADYSTLDSCVQESDLVFESIAEEIEAKEEIATRVGANLNPQAVSCTGTSGLSITEIASFYPESVRSRFFGVHMFNPPYMLPLCELVSTECSDGKLLSDLQEYLSNKLLRTVVEVKDAPAFLGNRIGFQFINEALLYAEKFKDNGGVDYMDAILGPFTGRAMAPLMTADFVGLDIHKAIVDNVYHNTHDCFRKTFILPKYIELLIDKGDLGRKTGSGLYKLVKGVNNKRRFVYDINTGMMRDVIPYAFPFSDKMKALIANGEYTEAFRQLITNHSQEARICLAFLLKYIAYALYSASEVGYTLEAADDVMATGFNWCPPIALCEALSSVADVSVLMMETIPEVCEEIDVEKLLADLKPSKYDYRRYFKSGR